MNSKTVTALACLLIAAAYPVAANEFAGGDGSEDNPWQISEPEHLDNIRNHMGDHFELINDIDLSGTSYSEGSGWQPIGACDYNVVDHCTKEGFTGLLDGNTHTITGLFIDREIEEAGWEFGNGEDPVWTIKDGTDGYISYPYFYPFYFDNQQDPPPGLENLATDAEPFAELPEEFGLDQNYPNPFNPATGIGFRLPEDSDVRLEIFDALGRRVTTLVDERMPAGVHQVTFDAGDLSSGVYIYRIRAGEFTESQTMMMVK